MNVHSERKYTPRCLGLSRKTEFLVKRRVQTQQNEKRGFDGPALSVRQTPESPLRASIYLIAGLGEFDQKGFFARIEVDFFDHADARGVELVLQ